MSTSKGSEWRKWDLHFHAPGTKLSDGFGKSEEAWDEFCTILHESDVSAFGITDYFSADCYFSAIKRYREKYGEDGKVFFPNIELRLNESVNPDGREINLHMIFNPEQKDFEEKLDTFLAKLNTVKKKGETYISAKGLKTEKDYSEAMTSRTNIEKAVLETYGSITGNLDHYLIICSANNNGIRADSGNQRKKVNADELDKFSAGFFGNAKSVCHFLKMKRGEDKCVRFSPKPVFSGCDAHSNLQLRNWLGEVVDTDECKLNPTWIKADLTYNGLKQTIFEPKNRVFIGKVPEIETRVQENSTKYIRSLKINQNDQYNSNCGQWFKDVEIVFGKELVCIIGNKGNGKSAISDIIGLLGNSYNRYIEINDEQMEMFSFLNERKFLNNGCAQQYDAKLEWYGGYSETMNLSDDIDMSRPERVEYLPQQYLDRLCASLTDNSIKSTLNQVIFRYVTEENRYGCRSMDELINFLSEKTVEGIDYQQQILHQINCDIVSIEKKLTKEYCDTIANKLSSKENELKAHNDSRPVKVELPAGKEHNAQQGKQIDAITTEIGKLQEEMSQQQENLASATTDLEQLKTLQNTLSTAKNRFKDFKTNYEQVLTNVGSSFDDVVTFDYNDTLLSELISNTETKITDIQKKLGDSVQTGLLIQKGELDGSESMQEKYEILTRKKSTLIQQQQHADKEYQLYVEKERIWAEKKMKIEGRADDPELESINSLKQELVRISDDYPVALEKEENSRLEVSKNIHQEKILIVDSIKAIKESITIETKQYEGEINDARLRIEANLNIDSEFDQLFFQHINQARTGNFYGIDPGHEVLNACIDLVGDWTSEPDVINFLTLINKRLHFSIQPTEPDKYEKFDIFNQMMRGDDSLVKLYDYLYGLDYLFPHYHVIVDNKELDELSPGERGNVLLLFFLLLDQRDTPLIIDQPEDNLDNMSVYDGLIKYIREAKRKRQIILVTHNPNLTVVADAEQIIHVSIDKSEGKNAFSFVSGSIESPRINRALVDILEGTYPAFDKRRLKYTP